MSPLALVNARLATRLMARANACQRPAQAAAMVVTVSATRAGVASCATSSALANPSATVMASATM